MTDPMGRQTQFTYDSAGRVTGVQHRVNSTGALIIGYAVTYDASGRVTRINESPTNAVTTYQYDGAGRLLREERTGNRPYLGEYQYDASGNRTVARRVENGVETHRGTYTCDGAGRLIRVVDAATGVTENYVWNADGTLASFPGPGYTRLLEYDEEGRLIRIRRDYGGGNVQLAYEYAYGFDGVRRWRKDYINGVWTRYPCGVACGAGDLVEQQKPLEGGSWTTTALYLQGISLVRRNSEWHHFDPLGTAGVITNNSTAVISNNLYDVFGVLRYEQGSAQTPWRWKAANLSEEGLIHIGGTYVVPMVNCLLHKPLAAGYVGIDIDWDCVKQCINKTLLGAIMGCLSGAGPQCGPCILLVVGTCILNPPSCGAMFSLCSLVCSGATLRCVWGAIIGGAGAFLNCYADRVRRKQQATPAPAPPALNPVAQQ